MGKYILLFVIISFALHTSAQNTGTFEPAIVIHGGAGTILPANTNKNMEAEIRGKLQQALDSGYAVLNRGASSIDAVRSAIMVLENDPRFNAGKGAVYNAKGEHELDAAIMDGASRKAGAVAGVQHVKNPIEAATGVMRQTPHVMLTGKGADEFARSVGLKMVPNDYFSTGHGEEKPRKDNSRGSLLHEPVQHFGTVGAVALDRHGNLAAGTSTGGLSGKKPGRVGDSPIIGAGTYASNKTCAISCTGQGEFFMRQVIAYDVAAMMQYRGFSLEQAAGHVIHQKLTESGGSGGLIGIDRSGNIAMYFNTPGMYRGFRKGSASEVKIFKD